MSSTGSSFKRSGKYRYITIADHNPDHWSALIDLAKSYDFYAYVFHEPDSDDGSRHIHILCMSHSPLMINSHAMRWESVVPKNMIQAVISPKRMARYLLHLDSPDKIKYQYSDITTNSVDHFSQLCNQSFKPDTLNLWKDYCLLRSHQMSPEDFLDKYRADISQLGLYQQFNIYQKIFDSGCVSFPAHDGANQGVNTSPTSPTD